MVINLTTPPAAPQRHPALVPGTNWRSRLALLTAAGLASLACLGTASAAQASPARAQVPTAQAAQDKPWCDSNPTGGAVLASEVKWGGTLYADSNGFLASPLKIADSSGSSGWHTSLLSYYGDYLLTMQDDGNLVLHHIGSVGEISCGGGPFYLTYDDLGVVWASNAGFKWGTGPVAVTIQGDGNLVVYYGNEPLWASDSSGSPHTTAYRLVVQDDGNLVIYLGSQVIWDRYDGSRR